MASTYLSRTPSSAGNQKTFTTSVWVKRATGTIANGDFEANNYILSYTAQSGTPRGAIWLYDTSTLVWGCNPSGSVWEPESYAQLNGNTVLFRDPSAWYHIVFAVDTTQATASDRLKCWVNGVQYSMSAYPAQNLDTGYNYTHIHNIGRYANSGTGYSSFLLSHYHQIDGTAYDASTFGESDANGVWTPKTSPSVTYGTNGFFLKFENSGSMGTDSSPNGNNFTVNGNLTQTVDTPSNVYATLNPLMLYPGNTVLANGNTSCSTASGYSHAYSTLAVSTGKWYWEAKLLSSTNNYFNVGIMDVSSPIISTTAYPLDTTNAYLYAVDGNLYQSGGSVLVNTGTTVSVGDIVGFYLDLDNGTLKLQKNGSNVYSGNAVITGLSSDKTWCVAHGATTSSVQFNFGNGYFGTTAVSTSNSDADSQGIFEYSPTLSGVNYYALNTKNLATYG